MLPGPVLMAGDTADPAEYGIELDIDGQSAVGVKLSTTSDDLRDKPRVPVPAFAPNGGLVPELSHARSGILGR